jgi:hypothetical protein
MFDDPADVTPYTPDRTAVDNADQNFRQVRREHVDVSNVSVTSWCF